MPLTRTELGTLSSAGLPSTHRGKPARAIYRFALAQIIRKNGLCISSRMITNKLNVHQWAMTNNEKNILCNITQQIKLYHEDLYILTWKEINNILLYKKDKSMNKELSQFL